jgi:hypothetical protein
MKACETAGAVNVTDNLDVFALVNEWTEFNNLAFPPAPRYRRRIRSWVLQRVG